MSNEITAPDGSKWQWKDGEWVKVDVKRGPLGGEQKRLLDCKGDEGVVYLASDPSYLVRLGLGLETLVETNVPPRLSGERMTAGEAARVEGIVGRWVAVPVVAININCDSVKTTAGIPGTDSELILLPEGFGE
jgi:hypothetical protein